MKKYLLFFTSAALLLVGCAKEQIVDLQEGGLTNVTFTANLDNGVATKAVADGDGAAANVNRCIMEIYFQNQLYKRMEAAMSGNPATATFSNVPVVAGKQYQILFWADCGGDGQIDKYYTTKTEGEGNKGLKAVTVNKTNFIDALKNKKNDELDAFYAAQNYTVSQQAGGNSFTVKLHRPFAQLNVITTDVAEGKTVMNADLLPEKVSVSYTAFNTFNVADSTVTGSEVYSYEADVYGDKSNWSDVQSRGELTLSMDYILADKEQGAVNVTFKTLNGTTEVMTHSLTNLPYKRNYRTNVKGDLLTVGGTWKAEFEPKWGNGTDTGEIDHIIASSYTEVVNALQSGNDSKNLKVTVTPAAVDLNKMSDAQKQDVIEPVTIDGENMQALKFVLYEKTAAHEASPEHVEFELPARPSGVAAWKIEYEPEYPTETVVVSTKEEDDANVIIEAPKSTVTLDATKVNSVVSTTSENTLIIPQGLELKNLTVKKGAVEYHGTGLEKVTIATEGQDKAYFKTSEGLANTDAVYGVVKNHVAPGYAITKESESTWKIVPEVCKIGTKSYGTLIDAVAAVQSGETITFVKDIENAAGIAIETGKNFTIDFAGHKYIVNKPGAGSTDTKTNAFQLLKGQTITFKNGTIEAAEDNLSLAVAPAKNIMRMFQSYANVNFEDMTIDCTNLYGAFAANEFACGTVSMIGNTSIFAKEGAKSINVDTWKDAYPEGTQVNISSVGEFGEIYLYSEGTAAQYTKSSLSIDNGKISKVYGDDSGDWTASISGGVFSEKPDASLIAEHFDAVANTDPATKAEYPWTVDISSDSPYVAKIGSTLYMSVQAAFAASKDNETIVLLKDTNRGSDQYTSSYGNNVTFDLNGHKIESNNSQGVFHFNGNEKNISFIDSKGNGGLVQLDCNPSSDQYSAICAEGANVNIYSGHYETKVSDHDWTQVLYAKGSNITVYGGTFIGDLFTNNQMHHMFPDWAPEANTIEIFGGVFTGKVLDSYAEDGVKSEVVIHGGKFSFNPTDFLAPGATCSGIPDAEGYYVVTSNN